jgi:hypothetical protein
VERERRARSFSNKQSVLGDHAPPYLFSNVWIFTRKRLTGAIRLLQETGGVFIFNHRLL